MEGDGCESQKRCCGVESAVKDVEGRKHASQGLVKEASMAQEAQTAI